MLAVEGEDETLYMGAAPKTLYMGAAIGEWNLEPKEQKMKQNKTKQNSVRARASQI